jgi:hypothetical protein
VVVKILIFEKCGFQAISDPNTLILKSIRPNAIYWMTLAMRGYIKRCQRENQSGDISFVSYIIIIR